MFGFEVGDQVQCRPLTVSGSWLGQDRQLHHNHIRTGRVCYIHPKALYLTVEIETLGGVIRESFAPEDVKKIPRKRRI